MLSTPEAESPVALEETKDDDTASISRQQKDPLELLRESQEASTRSMEEAILNPSIGSLFHGTSSWKYESNKDEGEVAGNVVDEHPVEGTTGETQQKQHHLQDNPHVQQKQAWLEFSPMRQASARTVATSPSTPSSKGDGVDSSVDSSSLKAVLDSSMDTTTKEEEDAKNKTTIMKIAAVNKTSSEVAKENAENATKPPPPSGDSPSRATAAQSSLKRKGLKWFRKRGTKENKSNKSISKGAERTTKSNNVIPTNDTTKTTTTSKEPLVHAFKQQQQDDMELYASFKQNVTPKVSTLNDSLDEAGQEAQHDGKGRQTAMSTSFDSLPLQQQEVEPVSFETGNLNASVIGRVGSMDSSNHDTHVVVKQDIVGEVDTASGTAIAHVASADSNNHAPVSVKKDIAEQVEESGNVVAHVASKEETKDETTANTNTGIENAVNSNQSTDYSTVDKEKVVDGGGDGNDDTNEKDVVPETTVPEEQKGRTDLSSSDSHVETKQDDVVSNEKLATTTSSPVSNDEKDDDNSAAILVAAAGVTIASQAKTSSSKRSSSRSSIFRRIGSPKRNKSSKKLLNRDDDTGSSVNAAPVPVVASPESKVNAEKGKVPSSDENAAPMDESPQKMATETAESSLPAKDYTTPNVEEKELEQTKDDSTKEVAVVAAAAIGVAATVGTATASAPAPASTNDVDAQKAMKKKAFGWFGKRQSNSSKASGKRDLSIEPASEHATAIDKDAALGKAAEQDSTSKADIINSTTLDGDIVNKQGGEADESVVAKAAVTQLSNNDGEKSESVDVDKRTDKSDEPVLDKGHAAGAVAICAALAVATGSAEDSSAVPEPNDMIPTDTTNVEAINDSYPPKAADWADFDSRDNVFQKYLSPNDALVAAAVPLPPSEAGDSFVERKEENYNEAIAVLGATAAAAAVGGAAAAAKVDSEQRDVQGSDAAHQSLREKASRWFGLRRSNSEKALEKDAAVDTSFQEVGDMNGTMPKAADWTDFDNAGVNAFKTDRSTDDALLAAAAVPLPPDSSAELRSVNDIDSKAPDDDAERDSKGAAAGIAGAVAIGAAMGGAGDGPPPMEDDHVDEYFDEEAQLVNKSKEAPSSRWKCSRRMKIIFIVLVHVVIVAAVLGIVVPMVFDKSETTGGSDGGTDPSPAATVAPNASPATTVPPNVEPTASVAPNASPTQVATVQPTVVPLSTTAAPVQQPLDVMLSSVSFDGGAALRTPFTAQKLAYDWLSSNTLLSTYSDEKRIQRYSLATLFYSTSGNDWENSTGWLTDADECTWFNTAFGGFCSDEGVVVEFDMMYNGMGGTIPEEIGLLPLEELNLAGNDLVGPIPTTIGMMSTLVDLMLWENQINGPLPSEIGLMTTLETLDLPRNALSGSIPTSVGLMSQLDWLSLSNNNLDGTIPAQINSMPSLNNVYLYNNNLQGTFTCSDDIYQCRVSCSTGDEECRSMG